MLLLLKLLLERGFNSHHDSNGFFHYEEVKRLRLMKFFGLLSVVIVGFLLLSATRDFPIGEIKILLQMRDRFRVFTLRKLKKRQRFPTWLRQCLLITEDMTPCSRQLLYLLPE